MVKELTDIILQSTSYSRFVVLGGTAIGALCIALGAVVHSFAPISGQYMQLQALSHAFFEVGPACMCTAIIAGVICELVYKHDLK